MIRGLLVISTFLQELPEKQKKSKLYLIYGIGYVLTLDTSNTQRHSSATTQRHKFKIYGSVYVRYLFNLGKKFKSSTSVEYTAMQLKNKITSLKKVYKKIKDELEDTGSR
jgi:hypothetical protein